MCFGEVDVRDERFPAVEGDQAKPATLPAFAYLLGVEAARLIVKQLAEPADRRALARSRRAGEE